MKNKIRWNRIVVAAIWSELLLVVLYIPTAKYAGSARPSLATLEMLIPLFLAGLWISRKIESHFVLHGVFVGIIANVLYVALRPLLTVLVGNEGEFQQGQRPVPRLVLIVAAAGLKIIAAVIGAYVGGKRRTAQLQTEKIKVSA